MKQMHYELMARMASQALQETFIDNATKDCHILPEEVYDDFMGSLRSLILRSDDPLKDRLLDLYVYCKQEADKASKDSIYGSPQWVNIRTAVKNFLLYLTEFDLEAWEKRVLTGAQPGCATDAAPPRH